MEALKNIYHIGNILRSFCIRKQGKDFSLSVLYYNDLHVKAMLYRIRLTYPPITHLYIFFDVRHLVLRISFFNKYTFVVTYFQCVISVRTICFIDFNIRIYVLNTSSLLQSPRQNHLPVFLFVKIF